MDCWSVAQDLIFPLHALRFRRNQVHLEGPLGGLGDVAEVCVASHHNHHWGRGEAVEDSFEVAVDWTSSLDSAGDRPAASEALERIPLVSR